MKEKIHPQYQEVSVHCSCGATWKTGSTMKELRLEICSNCHPFFTGKAKLIDTAGRVERFQKRYAKSDKAVAGRCRPAEQLRRPVLPFPRLTREPTDAREARRDREALRVARGAPREPRRRLRPPESTKIHRAMREIAAGRREGPRAAQGAGRARRRPRDARHPPRGRRAARRWPRPRPTACKGRVEALEEEIRLLLLPKDPNDGKNVVLEIRAGTGGDEAALFAEELFRMYVRYAEARGWRVEVIDRSESGGRGGIKEVQAILEGEGAFSRLKYEGGVHRVQRVPETESQGRIHTSAATVAILPEAEEVELEIAEKDLRLDLFCASGPGRAGRQHDLLRRPDHAPPDEHRRPVPGRALAGQEQGEGDARPEGPPLRGRAGAAGGGLRRRPEEDGRLGRPLREDPHLQLPAVARDGPPDRVHLPPPRRGPRRAGWTS